MTDKPYGHSGLADAEHHRKVIQIYELLHGLPIAQAHKILEQVGDVIGLTTFVDIRNGGFTAMVKDFPERFGEPYNPINRQ